MYGEIECPECGSTDIDSNPDIWAGEEWLCVECGECFNAEDEDYD